MLMEDIMTNPDKLLSNPAYVLVISLVGTLVSLLAVWHFAAAHAAGLVA
jgi:hypothetical protein